MAAIPESHREMIVDGQFASLSTNGADGFPQVTAIGYVVDPDGVVALSLGRARQKTKNLLRDPRATLFFVDPANPYRTVEIRAEAEIIDDTDYHHAAAINAKYNVDVSDNDRSGDTRVWVRFHPIKVNTFG